MHLLFPYNGIIVHKTAAVCNGKRRKTPEKSGFFPKNRLTSPANRAILGITCEWVLSFCALFRFGRGGGRSPGREAKSPQARTESNKEVPLMRVKITLRCNECKQRNYNTMKNKKNTPDKLELNKYCPFCRKHTLHTETK